MTSSEYDCACDEIERWVGNAFDQLDRQFMSSRMGQAEYDAACVRIRQQADARYARIDAKRAVAGYPR